VTRGITKNNLQAEKSKIFLELHKNNQLLILPNIWDPIGARILESKGFPAAATSSSAISGMLGYRDGENINITSHLDIIRRIVNSVNIPVTADIEAGYAADLSSLKESISQFIETGISGINFEDSFSGERTLRPLKEQCDRIAVIRETADTMGIHLVINARIDCFLIKDNKSEEERIDNTVKRAEAYIKAGADCVYPITAYKKETIINLRKRIDAPLNIFASPLAPSLKELQEIGINRVSFGAFIFRSYLKKLEGIAEQLFNLGSYDCFSKEMMTQEESAGYVINEKER
jgi:2-methylisocitrate lyase-like PEP mutase family enzyme